MNTTVALYEDLAAAQQAVEALVAQGFDPETISLVANHATDISEATSARGEGGDSDDIGIGEGVATGMAEGTLLGILAGLGALVLPGIGPVLAVGPFIGALTGAVVGALTGGLVAALVDLGIPESEAELYAESIRRGGALLTLEVEDERLAQATALLEQYGPLDIEQQGQEWRERGWSGHDANAQPLAADEILKERTQARQHRAPGQGNSEGASGTGEDLSSEEQRAAVPASGVRVHAHPSPPSPAE